MITRTSLVSFLLVSLSTSAVAEPRRRMFNKERETRAEEASSGDGQSTNSNANTNGNASHGHGNASHTNGNGKGNASHTNGSTGTPVATALSGPAQAVAGCGDLQIEAVWEGVSSGRPWYQGEPLGTELVGCVADPELSYSWSTQGASVVGSGKRVNVIAEAADVTITACVQRSAEPAQCTALTVAAAPTRPTLTIDAVTTLLPGPGGRWVHAHGAVTATLDPAGLSVLLFKHTDVYYVAASPIAVASDGTWMADFWMASNVNTVDAVAVSAPVDLATLPGCTSSWCFGRIDPITRRRLPIDVDGTTAVAGARHMLMSGEATDALAFLQAQRIPLATGAMVRSSLDTDALFVYDQAIAATAFALADQQADARDILDALVAVQRSDGSFAFSYRKSGTTAVEVSPEVSYAGANAWVALAMNAYDGRFQTTTYRAAAGRLIDYLVSQLVDADVGRAVRFNPVDLTSTSWSEPQLTAVEHALETLAALEGAADLGANRKADEILALTAYLQARWASDHFRPGYYLPTGENTAELYLDNQALAVMAWKGDGDMTHGLTYNCDTFGAGAGFLGSGELGMTGFIDFLWADEARAAPYIWAEGSAMMASALRIGASPSCPTSAAVLAGIADLTLAPQTTSFPASTVGRYNGYGQRSSVSAAAWYAIAQSGRNPLRP